MGDRADYIAIKFYNTPLYLRPAVGNKQPIPNGW